MSHLFRWRVAAALVVFGGVSFAPTAAAQSLEWRAEHSSSPGRVRRTPAASGMRLVVSVKERHLWALKGRDTVYSAPVSVAPGVTLTYAGQRWRFATPRGGRKVLRKTTDPVWTPPDWYYAEVARSNGLHLANIPKRGVGLSDGSRLVVRDSLVGIVFSDGSFEAMPRDEHIVFGDVLFVPPVGTLHRRISGTLGRFALDLGDGYMIHGTQNQDNVGKTPTHGCMRVRDEDLTWLYDNVPIGAPVTIR